MKNKKINLLTLGVLVTMLISSTPTFAASNTSSNNINKSIATGTSANSGSVVSAVALATLTASVSNSSISAGGSSLVSGYAKSSDGTPLVNALIWIKVDSGDQSYVYARLNTDSLGYYSTIIYGHSLSRMGYFAVNAYIDNGTNVDENGYGQVGHGTYEVDYNVWSDVKSNLTSIYVHN